MIPYIDLTDFVLTAIGLVAAYKVLCWIFVSEERDDE